MDGGYFAKGAEWKKIRRASHNKKIHELPGIFVKDVTSELKTTTVDVIDKYHGLTQIEDQFRVMKGDLETRPVYVRTPEHIDAHLLICLIALIMMRIIQKRIRDMDPGKEKDVYWNVGMSGERIQRARCIFSKL